MDNLLFFYSHFRCASYVGFVKDKAADGQNIYLHEYCIINTPSNQHNIYLLFKIKYLLTHFQFQIARVLALL